VRCLITEAASDLMTDVYQKAREGHRFDLLERGFQSATEEGHRREKRNLIKQLKEVKTDMRALKIHTSKLKKKMEMELKMSKECHKQEREVLTTHIEELQQELQSVKKNLEEKMKGEVRKHRQDLRFYRQEKRQQKKELEALKVANINLKKQLELERKNNEEGKVVLQRRNQALQQELEALKARVPTNNLQLACSGSESQGQTVSIGGTAEGKVSIDSFQPVRMLGEGSYGKVILVRKKPSYGSNQHFAMKVLEKSDIVSITNTIIEKEALILASGHPFITTLFACFQTKEHLFFVMEYVSGSNMADELDKVKVFSEERARFYAAEITLALEFLHRCGIFH